MFICVTFENAVAFSQIMCCGYIRSCCLGVELWIRWVGKMRTVNVDDTL